MSRILKRPMFRKGGEVTEGIVSMAAPRKNYADGPSLGDINIETGETYGIGPTGYPTIQGDIQYTPSTQTITTTGKTRIPDIGTRARYYADIAQKLVGSGAGYDPTGKFLTEFGLNLMSARPVGGRGIRGLLTTAAGAAKEPTKGLYEGLDKREAAKKQLALLGLQQAFAENLAYAKGGKEYAPDKLRDPARRYKDNIERLQKVYGPESTNIMNQGKLKNDQIKAIAANDVLQNIGKAPYARVSFTSLSKGTITNPAFLDPKTNMPKEDEFEPGVAYVNPSDGSTWLYEGKNKFKKIFEIKAEDYELLRKP